MGLRAAAGANSANYRTIPSHRSAHVPIIFNKLRQRPEVTPNKCCQDTTERRRSATGSTPAQSVFP